MFYNLNLVVCPVYPLNKIFDQKRSLSLEKKISLKLEIFNSIIVSFEIEMLSKFPELGPNKHVRQNKRAGLRTTVQPEGGLSIARTTAQQKLSVCAFIQEERQGHHHWQGRTPKKAGLRITTQSGRRRQSITRVGAQQQPHVCVHPRKKRSSPPLTTKGGGVWLKLIHCDLMGERKVVLSVLISYFVSLNFMTRLLF